MLISIREIAPVFPGYEKVWELRNDILRKPLGLFITQAEVLQESDQIHLVAFDQDLLLGCVLLVPSLDGVTLRQMAVAVTAQGLGIGGKLLNAAEDCARQRGYSLVSCHARESAVGFYQRHGWVVEGKRFIEVTLPHFAMKKQL